MWSPWCAGPNEFPLQELPLRIVIDSKHVGAIIGTGGNNVREITKESKARVVVDVQRTVKDQQGHSEKVSVSKVPLVYRSRPVKFVFRADYFHSWPSGELLKGLRQNSGGCSTRE